MRLNAACISCLPLPWCISHFPEGVCLFIYIDYRLYMYTCIRAHIGAKRPQSVLLRIRAHVSNHVIQYIAVFEATNRINMHLKGTHTESTGSCSDRAHTEYQADPSGSSLGTRARIWRNSFSAAALRLSMESDARWMWSLENNFNLQIRNQDQLNLYKHRQTLTICKNKDQTIQCGPATLSSEGSSSQLSLPCFLKHDTSGFSRVSFSSWLGIAEASHNFIILYII